MKVGIVGCGFIGNELAMFIDKNREFRLIGVNDIDKKKADALRRKLKNDRPACMKLDSLIKKSDLIIEAASKEVIGKILRNKNLDKKGKRLLIMSTGGLVNNLHLLREIKNCMICIPSGTIAGLDAIKAASGRIKSLKLSTTKPVKGLENAPYILKNKIDLKKIRSRRLIFEGSLKDAIGGFPRNINVAATLFLASKSGNIKVKIAADPNTKYNMHEIEAKGEFGVIKTIANNLPSKNPKTSYLAVLSAMQAIKNIKNKVRWGIELF